MEGVLINVIQAQVFQLLLHLQLPLQLQRLLPVTAAPTPTTPAVTPSAPDTSVPPVEVPQPPVTVAEVAPVEVVPPVAIPVSVAEPTPEAVESPSTATVIEEPVLKEAPITVEAEVPNIPDDAPLKIDEEKADDELPQIEKKGKKLFMLGVFITLLTILITGIFAFLFIFQPEKKEVTSEISTPTPTSAEEVAEEFDRSEWEIDVLNGSAIAGAAQKLADQLEEAGYIIVAVGNADNKDYEITTLYVDKELEGRPELIADLKKEIGSLEISDEPIDGSSATVTIIIGSN